MKTYIITVKEKRAMAIIRKGFAKGAEYANTVTNLAVQLDEVAKPFYRGSLLSDYGEFPFLNVEAFEFEENNVYSMQTIASSRMDEESLNEWIDSLSLTKQEKGMMHDDIRKCYKKHDGALDYGYLSALIYVKQILRLFAERREDNRAEIDSLLQTPIGGVKQLRLNETLTMKYIARKITKLNRTSGRKTGKYFFFRSHPSEDKTVLLHCTNYDKPDKP